MGCTSPFARVCNFDGVSLEHVDLRPGVDVKLEIDSVSGQPARSFVMLYIYRYIRRWRKAVVVVRRL